MSTTSSNQNNEEAAIIKIDQASNTQYVEKKSPIKIPIESPSNSNLISPRISTISHSEDVIGDNYIEEQKPILSSPSIIITSPNSPISPGKTNHFISSFSRSDDDFDEHDDINKSTHLKNFSNWSHMSNFFETSMANSNIDHCKGKDALTKESSGRIDVSLYTTKKNVVQGMLIIALLSANCSQLKYLLYNYELNSSNTENNAPRTTIETGLFGKATIVDLYFLINLIQLILSVILQVIIGILLILNSRRNIFIYRHQRVTADNYSNWILLIAFIVTIVNLFLSVFISAQ